MALASGGPGASHLNVRAEALALLGHHGSLSTLTGSGGAGAQALPPGVPGVVAPGGRSDLRGVFCTSASNCWAVGSFDSPTTGGGTATLNQVLHWNGSTWSQVMAPSPGGTADSDFSELTDVRCRTASDCWSVGSRWDGTKWSRVTTPQPAGNSAGDFQGLSSIRCTSSSNCLAVGSFGTEGSTVLLKNEALRWNGTTWSTLTVPSPGGTGNFDFSEMSSLACTSATNCWSAGAFGSFATRTSLNQVMHWNGATWTQDTTIRNPDGSGQGSVNELLGATCTSASNCWAVGDFGSIQNGLGEILNQTLHWNGTAWSLILPPDPGGIADGDTNALNAIRCNTTANCWAVGQVMNPSVNQALRWNGTMWAAG